MFRVQLHVDVFNEITELPPIVQAKMLRLIDKIKQNATSLREPDSKPLGNGLFEIRTMGTHIARGLYVYQKGRVIYLLRVFVKKTAKTPTEEIRLAFQRLEEMLNEKE